MMSDPPRRVTPADICALLDQLRALAPDTPLPERIAYHQRKARLLSGIAADLDTPKAHAVAAEAWDQLAALTRHPDQVAGDRR